MIAARRLYLLLAMVAVLLCFSFAWHELVRIAFAFDLVLLIALIVDYALTPRPYLLTAERDVADRLSIGRSNPVLLKVNMGAGHGGESGRFERQKLIAMKYAFALSQLGWNEQTKTYNAPKSF